MIRSNIDPKVLELYSSESRYFHNANVVSYDGNQMFDIPYSSDIDNDIDDEYIVVTSDYQNRYDKIAQNKYSNSKLWWVLADTNNMDNPFVLELDEVLRIPPLSRLLLDEVI